MQREVFQQARKKTEKNGKKIVIKYFFGSIAEQTFRQHLQINERKNSQTQKIQPEVYPHKVLYIFFYSTNFLEPFLAPMKVLV